MTTGSTYKVVELVGSSSESVQQAIDGAIARAAQTIRNLNWFEVREIRGTIDGDSANWYQVKLGIGFRSRLWRRRQPRLGLSPALHQYGVQHRHRRAQDKRVLGQSPGLRRYKSSSGAARTRFLNLQHPKSLLRNSTGKAWFGSGVSSSRPAWGKSEPNVVQAA